MPPRRGHKSPVRPARARRASSSERDEGRDEEVVYASGEAVDYHSRSRRRWIAATVGECTRAWSVAQLRDMPMISA